MKEGFWANYITKRWFLIDEHELWIRRKQNADLLSIPEAVQQQFSLYKIQIDRDAFLQFVFQHAPVMRIRGHGELVSFEFSSNEWNVPLELIHVWCKAYAGPYTGLNIYNFGTGSSIQTIWKDWNPSLR